MLNRLQKEIARKIAPFREKEILVQYINDSGGMGLREGTLSSFFEEATKYLCISVQERGGLYPPILVGATHSDSQLARIVSE
ncbi:MAG: hypothetical protein IIB81_03870, partial [Nanoarchaeota archaeon]|nr:hypothetical protein [Nanoarchaeota archaeon]